MQPCKSRTCWNSHQALCVRYRWAIAVDEIVFDAHNEILFYLIHSVIPRNILCDCFLLYTFWLHYHDNNNGRLTASELGATRHQHKHFVPMYILRLTVAIDF